MEMKNTLQGHRKMALVLRKDLGKYLKERREELVMTLWEVASKVGYDYMAQSEYSCRKQENPFKGH